MHKHTIVLGEGKLYEDAKWKETSLSKAEILLDDRRNKTVDYDFSDFMCYGKTYKVTMIIEEVE